MIAGNLRLIGKLSKLHGYEGEAILITEDIFPKKFNKTEWVFLMIDGLPVPFSISQLSLRSDSSAILKFEDIDTSEKMKPFIGLEIFIEETRKSTSKSKSDTNNISGYKVIDNIKGEIGIAETVINYNDNYLLQVFNKDTEILIPVSDEIILEINDKSKTILVNTPEGLLDLYL